ncbi:MAG: hypothetical protein PHQ75_05750 [Thermoguttaceae bacterium]|nr:hypothetical protein [Thermoguttaceae bacterium]
MSERNTEISDLEQVILETASGPKKVSSDAGSVEQHSLSDLIKAEKYLASKEAAKGNGIGIKLSKIEPDGTL